MKIKSVLAPFLAAGVLAAFHPGRVLYAAVKADGQDVSGYVKKNEDPGKSGIRGRAIFLAEREREREEGEEGEEGEKRGEKERFTAPEDPLYTKECSSCHFLYQPGLLPGRSWSRLIKTSEKHFGEDLALDDKTKGDLLAYLTANSAEKSDTEWSIKIMRSAGSSTPERITKVPYIASRHRKIRPGVFKRPSIKSFSNCGACHTKGAEGNYEERTVVIPK